ncbi:hypothetical protein [Microbacterium sp.]|uniref:hypothetical protein n=1 Tax=Microbacterium sp. TaxID=51671 RepID=UPI002811164F|nr:hypothetical protein [Microbacterium sp.]
MTAEQIAFHVQYASVDTKEAGDAAPAATRILRSERVLAAVRDGSGEETVVLVPLTEDGAIVAMDAEGALRFDLTAERLRELFAAEGLTLWLERPDGLDELDAELDEEFGEAFEDLDDDVLDGTARTDDPAGFGMPGDDDDLPDGLFAVEPVRVAEFSRRGPWAARITSQLLRTDVAYVEEGSWSLYRYDTDQPHMVITGGRADGLVVEVNLPSAGDAWVEVTTPGGRTGIFWPNAERLTVPVLDIEAIARPQTAEVYRRMLTELDGTRDELQELSVGASVDVDAAHRACMPESVGGVSGEGERLRSFVAAFGVPADLISRGFADDDGGADARRFAPRGWMPVIGDVLLGGMSEMTPLTRRDRALPRIARALRERPLLGAAVSTAELTAGLAMVRSRSRFARVVGVLAVIDAVADLVIWVMRMRRR